MQKYKISNTENDNNSSSGDVFIGVDMSDGACSQDATTCYHDVIVFKGNDERHLGSFSGEKLVKYFIDLGIISQIPEHFYKYIGKPMNGVF